MDNLAHVIATTGTIKKWRDADRQGYYLAGYVDTEIKVFKCSACGKRIGEYKLLYGNYCPNCGVKFGGTMSDTFKEKCDKLVAHLKNEKKKIDKKINSTNYRQLGEAIDDINYYLRFISFALDDWSSNKITGRFYKCNELYSKMLDGKLNY